MGATAMAVGGAFGIVSKGTMNRLMKVSLRRGESREKSQKRLQGPRQHVCDIGVRVI